MKLDWESSTLKRRSEGTGKRCSGRRILHFINDLEGVCTARLGVVGNTIHDTMWATKVKI